MWVPCLLKSFLHTDHHQGQTGPLKRIKCRVAHSPTGFYVNYQWTRFSTSQQTEHNNNGGCHFLSDSSNYQSVTWEIDGVAAGEGRQRGAGDAQSNNVRSKWMRPLGAADNIFISDPLKVDKQSLHCLLPTLSLHVTPCTRFTFECHFSTSVKNEFEKRKLTSPSAWLTVILNISFTWHSHRD